MEVTKETFESLEGIKLGPEGIQRAQLDKLVHKPEYSVDVMDKVQFRLNKIEQDIQMLSTGYKHLLDLIKLLIEELEDQ